MFQIIDILIFALCSVFVLYLFIFMIASLFTSNLATTNSVPERRIAILIPAYKEDKVIASCVTSCKASYYPTSHYSIIVISDGMQQTTVDYLRNQNITLLEVDFENSTKSKALNYAFSRLDSADFDLALVLDADNTVPPNFLSQINQGFKPRFHAIQAHRTAKNTNGSLATLDAVSEEINNTIFRQAHVNLDLSAALIGSGMVFYFDEFKTIMSNIKAIGGFDKELEHVYLERGCKIGYLKDAIIFDEKVSDHNNFGNQRRRWISAQIHYLRRYSVRFIPALMRGNIDFADKIFQMLMPPRILLVTSIFIFSLLATLFSFDLSIKWWMLLGVLISTLFICIPRSLLTRKLFVAILSLPKAIFVMSLNLFRIKGSNKQFIHTSHGD